MKTEQFLNPFTAESIEDPYPVHRALRERGVTLVEETGTWMVSRFADVTYVLQHPELFSSRNVGGGASQSAFGADEELRAIVAEGWPKYGGLTPLDPPEHAWYRRIVAEPFSPKGVLRLSDSIAEIVDELIDSMAPKGQADLVAEFARPFPLPVFADLIGYPRDAVPQIKTWSDEHIEMMAAAVGLLPRERVLELARSDLDYQRYLHQLFEDRRREPRDDLLTLLTRATLPDLDNRPLTDGEMISSVFTLIEGGNETTINLVANGMATLLTHPDQHRLVLDDPSLIPNFVEESLRYESPVQCLFRTTNDDTLLGGVLVSARARLAVLYGAANRDPDRWDRPDAFDVRRPDARKAVSFGAGIHFCIGAHLARLEGRIAFEALLRRLPNLRLIPDRNDLMHHRSPIVRGLQHLWVEWS